jgi:hypothetical protein
MLGQRQKQDLDRFITGIGREPGSQGPKGIRWQGKEHLRPSQHEVMALERVLRDLAGISDSISAEVSGPDRMRDLELTSVISNLLDVIRMRTERRRRIGQGTSRIIKYLQRRV